MYSNQQCIHLLISCVHFQAVKGSLFQGKPLIMKWYSPKPHLTSPAAPTTPTTITPTTTVSPPTNDVVTKSHVTSNEGHQLENQTEKKKKSPPSSLTLLEEVSVWTHVLCI